MKRKIKRFSRKERTGKDGFAVSSETFITNHRTCVGVKIGTRNVQVCNTKDRSKKTVIFTKKEWKAFLGGAKAGEFDA